VVLPLSAMQAEILIDSCGCRRSAAMTLQHGILSMQSIHPSVCPIDRQQNYAVVLPLSAMQAEILIDSCGCRRSAAMTLQHGIQQQMRAVSC